MTREEYNILESRAQGNKYSQTKNNYALALRISLRYNDKFL